MGVNNNVTDDFCSNSNDSQENIDIGEDNNIYTDRKMWKTVQDLVGKQKQLPPRNLVINVKGTTSLKRICNYSNNFFINKVNKIREKFSKVNRTSAINILNELLPRSNNNLQFKYIDSKGFKKILKRAKGSNSLGNDIISMKTLKKIGDRINPYMVHLINSIIDTEIFKTSRISPTLKPDKPRADIDSYRPINNLSALEKLVEQFFKDCLIDHF